MIVHDSIRQTHNNQLEYINPVVVGSGVTNAIAEEKAKTYLKLLPYLIPEKQNVTDLSGILGVSKKQIYEWHKMFGLEIAQMRGGANK